MNDIVSKARVFATAAHAAVGQKRKYTLEDYIVHPTEVVEILLNNVPCHTKDGMNMLAAAWMHDVVEDTKVTFDQLLEEFGSDITQLVNELTDISKPDDGNRAGRKQIDRYHTKNASPRAKTIKLADLISNSRSIIQHDPDFAEVYMAEKALLLNYLGDGDRFLWKQADNIVKDYYNRG